MTLCVGGASFGRMFTIIGGDGKEYGPATAEQIRAWIAGGRANLETKARAVGTDEWRRLGDYPEFAPADAAPPMIAAAVPAAEAGATTTVDTAAPRETRLLARLIDWLIQVMAMMPGMMLLGMEALHAILQAARTGEFDFEGMDTVRVATGAITLGVAMLVLLIVQLWLLSTRGQSLGKLIVRADSGAKAGFVRAWLLREFVPALIGIVPFVGPFLLRPLYVLVDCCFIFREDRRCVHDLIAGTKVVKA